MTEPAEWIAVGLVTKAHGVKGEVSILSLTDVEERYEPGSHVFAGEGRYRELAVSTSRPHGQRVLVKFEGIDDRNAADLLRGQYLFVPAAAARELPEGEYWPHQLVGCEVVTDSGRRLGTLREVMRSQANDVWAADGEEGEVLIPALKDVVASVDVAARRVVVREVPGITVP